MPSNKKITSAVHIWNSFYKVLQRMQCCTEICIDYGRLDAALGACKHVLQLLFLQERSLD